MKDSLLLYDVEIARPIPSKKEPMVPGIEYAESWTDFAGMGIAVISAYDYKTGFPRLFCKDNIEELFVLMEAAEYVIGFNNKRFDDKIMEAIGYTVPEEKSYDMFIEIKQAAGAGQYAKGYNLDNCCRVNLGYGKEGDAAEAPILWQRGQTGRVMDYGLRDIMMSKGLLDLILTQPIIDPGNTSDRIFVRKPGEQ